MSSKDPAIVRRRSRGSLPRLHLSHPIPDSGIAWRRLPPRVFYSLPLKFPFQLRSAAALVRCTVPRSTPNCFAIRYASRLKPFNPQYVPMLSVTTGTYQPSLSLPEKKARGTMPIYQFVVRSGDHEDDADVRWSHLPDEGAARRYGHLLMKDFKSSGRYPDSSHPPGAP